MRKIKRYIFLMALAFSLSNTIFVSAEETDSSNTVLTDEQKYANMKQIHYTENDVAFACPLELKADYGILSAVVGNPNSQRNVLYLKKKSVNLDFASKIGDKLTYRPSWSSFSIDTMNTKGSFLYHLKNTFFWSDDEVRFLVDNFDFNSANTIRWQVDDCVWKTDFDYEIIPDEDFSFESIDHLWAYYFNELKDVLFNETLWKDGNFEKPNSDNNYMSDLPLLTFNVKTSIVVEPMPWQSGISCKHTWTWDYSTKQVYKDNPNNYYVEMVASATLTKSGYKDSVNFDESKKFINEDCKVAITKCPIYKDTYSYISSEIFQTLVKRATGLDKSSSPEQYYIFIRIVSKDGSQKSGWKVYKVASRLITQEDIILDDDLNEYEIEEDDKDPDADDDLKYEEDASTDSDNDESSDLKNNEDESMKSNVNTAMSNLKSIVNTIKDLPGLFKTLCGWMPDYIITLIGIGIGLIVIVGIVKWFL